MMKVLLILLSAALHALPFPPWNVTWVAWVALVPFLYVIGGLRPGRAFLAGLFWGHATHWALAYWVPPALTFYYGQAWWFGVLFGIGTSPVFWTGYFALFALCACWLGRRCQRFTRVLLVSVLWVACEFARARLLTGAPWLLLGYSLLPHLSLIQAADLGGPYLLSFLVVLVNASLTEVLRIRFSLGSRGPGSAWMPVVRILAPAGALLFAFYAYGVHRLATQLPSTPAVQVAVVQANNIVGAQWQPGFYGQGLEQYLRLSAEAAERLHPQLIVWPEAAVTMFLAHEPQYQALITRLLQASRADLIVGAPHYTDDDPARPQYFNSAFYMTSDGRLVARYDKVHLLPFAEYFPLHSLDFLRRRFERVRVFTAGERSTLLDTRFGKAAVVICFEAIFPELVRDRMEEGAQVLVNLSNDVWLGRGAGPAQHLTMVRLRAVENRTWLVRATSTGISAIVDPYGRVRTQSETFTPAVLDAQVVPLRVETVYKRFGDVFAYACVLLSLAGLLAHLRRRGWREKSAERAT